ncbi:hypothetical protein AFUB_070990 [Aspergillus fumigatus A1163]|uniref:Subtelomeric hrmA-associated cluster protein AFUB-079030/YDR124W-like helical bundle domain-containing protein n=1 Tax=Aspergillus fumigatus (strain CBS 144.89 / FGSC A1163 / CEA10) TaxID=451804 RepID=B0Y509_ASPFC|nr:hypothetical protein AFUB_070990 [Aspergillus fumigatus A1163]
MVFSAPAPGVDSSKRPASCMQDDVNDQDNVLVSDTSIGRYMRLTPLLYSPWVYPLKVIESPSIQEQNETVFTTEVCERFLEILGAKIGYQPPMVRRLSAAGATPYSYEPQQLLGHFSYRQTKRARNSPANSKYGVPPSVQFSVTVEETPSCGSVDIVGLKIGDTPKVLEYYERSLKHFRQFNCREVAKAFIKFIEPGKQVKHPYNGGKPPAGAPPGKKGDPEKTKPEWWPADVVHKEPDHLRRNRMYTPPENLQCQVTLLTDLERLSLLIHIIRKLGRFGITTDQLQEIAHDCKRRLSSPHKLQILDEVFRVRRIEERYERGEVGKPHLLSMKFI